MRIQASINITRFRFPTYFAAITFIAHIQYLLKINYEWGEYESSMLVARLIKAHVIEKVSFSNLVDL